MFGMISLKERVFAGCGWSGFNGEVAMQVRYRLKNKARFMFSIAVLLFFVWMIVLAVSSAAAKPTGGIGEPIVVRGGDTLWEIASTHCAEGDVREYIHDIRQINRLESGIIYEGQVLYLPE